MVAIGSRIGPDPAESPGHPKESTGMAVTYYKPKTKERLKAHLLESHSKDVIALAKGMTVKDLEKVHDHIHQDQIVPAEEAGTGGELNVSYLVPGIHTKSPIHILKVEEARGSRTYCDKVSVIYGHRDHITKAQQSEVCPDCLAAAKADGR
jgi:hypothetical protein